MLQALLAAAVASSTVVHGSAPDPSLLPLTAASAAEGPNFDLLLQGDDECHGAPTGASDASPSCSLNQLQLRAGAARAAEATDEADEVTIRDAQNRSEGVCPTRGYSGKPTGAESCFCHKARNPVCVSKPCSCREGCGGMLRESWAGSTFENTVSLVTGCLTKKGPKAFLTIPKTYATDINDLVKRCGIGASTLLGELMAQGTEAYRKVYPKGPIIQCIHKAHSVSVHWLHIHVLCRDGRVEDLPNKRDAYCVQVNNRGEAFIAASKVTSWAYADASKQAFRVPVIAR